MIFFVGFCVLHVLLITEVIIVLESAFCEYLCEGRFQKYLFGQNDGHIFDSLEKCKSV